MARPSVKKERTEEILQAYERCIALYGVEGATLQKIAEEAGIARPLLRHHVGNSDDLLKHAVKRFIQRSDALSQELYIAFPDDGSGKDFIDALFYSDNSKDNHNDVMIAASFIYAAQTHSDIRKQMQAWLKKFIKGFTTHLQKIYPHANAEQIKDISAGIIGIYFNVDSLAPLGTNKDLRAQSYRAALYLLNTLESEKNK